VEERKMQQATSMQQAKTIEATTIQVKRTLRPLLYCTHLKAAKRETGRQSRATKPTMLSLFLLLVGGVAIL